MAKLLFSIVFLFLSSEFSVAQNWQQYNYGGTSTLQSVSFVNPNTGWACGGWSGNDGVIIKTTNGGLNWSIQYSNVPVIYWIHFIDQNTGFAVRYANIFMKTTNGGVNWIESNISGATLLYYVYFSGLDTGYLTGRTSIYKTVNGGGSWTSQDPNTGEHSNWGYFLNANTGFLGCQNGVINTTTNGGLNWIPRSTGFSDWMSGGFGFINSSTGFSPTYNKILKTTNGGINWVNWFNDTNNYVRFVTFVNNYIGYCSGSNGRILKTTNAGNTWFIDYQCASGLWAIRSISNIIYCVGDNGVILKCNDYQIKAILNDIYRPNDGRSQTVNITLSDSLCTGQIDSVYWYVNDSLVGRQHNMTYPFKQGTSLVKLKIRNQNSTDSVIAKVTRCVFKKFFPGKIYSGLSYHSNNAIYCPVRYDKIYRLDNYGNVIYYLTPAGNLLSEVAISSDGKLFFGDSLSFLYGFSNNGTPLWSPIPLGATISATPSVDNYLNRLYIGTINYNFNGIDYLSGSSAWNYFTNASVQSCSVIDSLGVLAVASSVGGIYAFNLNLPNPTPPFATLFLNDSIIVSPAIDSNGIFYFGGRSGKLYKISLKLGQPPSTIWQNNLNSPITSSPVIDVNGNIYVGVANGRLFSVSRTGTTRWYFQTPAQIKSTAAITPNHRIYFGNDIGEIYGLDTNGNKVFYFSDSSKITC